MYVHIVSKNFANRVARTKLASICMYHRSLSKKRAEYGHSHVNVSDMDSWSAYPALNSYFLSNFALNDGPYDYVESKMLENRKF